MTEIIRFEAVAFDFIDGVLVAFDPVVCKIRARDPNGAKAVEGIRPCRRGCVQPYQ